MYLAGTRVINGAVSIMYEKIIIEEPLDLRTYIINIKQTSDIFLNNWGQRKYFKNCVLIALNKF